MTKKIFNTTLRAFQIRKPFKPFIIEIVSGGELLVQHPEAVVTNSGASVFFAPDGAITLFEAGSVARLSDVRAMGGARRYTTLR